MMSDNELMPKGLRKSGRALWAAVNEHLDLDRHEAQLLLEACRLADRLDLLDGVLRKNGLVLADGAMNPALGEARAQQITLTRLIASLRLPADLAEPDRRPQRRGAARGVYGDRRGLRVIGE